MPARVTPASDWSFSLRDAVFDDDDDDDLSVNDPASTAAPLTSEEQIARDIDLGAREDHAQFKPNPWSIAKVNAATRKDVAPVAVKPAQPQQPNKAGQTTLSFPTRKRSLDQSTSKPRSAPSKQPEKDKPSRQSVPKSAPTRALPPQQHLSVPPPPTEPVESLQLKELEETNTSIYDQHTQPVQQHVQHPNIDPVLTRPLHRLNSAQTTPHKNLHHVSEHLLLESKHSPSAPAHTSPVHARSPVIFPQSHAPTTPHRQTVSMFATPGLPASVRSNPSGFVSPLVNKPSSSVPTAAAQLQNPYQTSVVPLSRITPKSGWKQQPSYANPPSLPRQLPQKRTRSPSPDPLSPPAPALRRRGTDYLPSKPSPPPPPPQPKSPVSAYKNSAFYDLDANWSTLPTRRPGPPPTKRIKTSGTFILPIADIALPPPPPMTSGSVYVPPPPPPKKKQDNGEGKWKVMRVTAKDVAVELERLKEKEREQEKERSLPVADTAHVEASRSSAQQNAHGRHRSPSPSNLGPDDIALPLDAVAASYPDLRTRISEQKHAFLGLKRLLGLDSCGVVWSVESGSREIGIPVFGKTDE